MTLTPPSPGSVLFFSRQELALRHLTPETLTDGDLLTLIRRCLGPLPLSLELRTFPSPQGVLVFLLPQGRPGDADCYFSVTFS